MNLGQEIDNIGRDIAAMKHVESVVERLKEVVFGVIDGKPGVGDLMTMLEDAYRSGWNAGQEKQHEQKSGSDFTGCAHVGASAGG